MTQTTQTFRVMNQIDELIWRRISQITATSNNAHEREELAKNARKKLEVVLEEWEGQCQKKP